MTSLRPTRRPKGSKNLTEGQKAAIITLRVSGKLSFPEISTKLGVNDKTAGKAFGKAKQEACSDDLRDLINTLNPKPSKAKRPSKVEDGSGLLKQSRANVSEIENYNRQDACHHILAEAGISFNCHSILRIIRGHRDPDHPYAGYLGLSRFPPHFNLQHPS